MPQGQGTGRCMGTSFPTLISPLFLCAYFKMQRSINRINMFLFSLSLLSQLMICFFSLKFNKICLCFCLLIWVFLLFSTDEFIQHKGSDAALIGFWGLRFTVGWCCSVYRLLAADGRGNRPAAEPDQRSQDGTALRPLESLLCGR